MNLASGYKVIRNEALLLLTYLTREAEEIQKNFVFEGAFDKIFSIIREEGGVVVQDSLELLNNLLCKNVSNQILLRETMGFDPLISILKMQGSAYSFTQQKTINLLSALETINLLIMGGSVADPGKDSNRLANKMTLVQKKLLDRLLMLGVESSWEPVMCTALRLFGDDVLGALNIQMVEVARSVGTASKFTGSGEAVVVFCPNGPSQVKFVEDACQKAGFRIEPIKVAPSAQCSNGR